jgi:hypothetical protein
MRSSAYLRWETVPSYVLMIDRYKEADALKGSNGNQSEELKLVEVVVVDFQAALLLAFFHLVSLMHALTLLFCSCHAQI